MRGGKGVQGSLASPPQQRQPAVATSDPSRIWLPEIVERFARSLTPNEVAGTLRLVNKAAAAQFSAPQHAVIRLSQPVPHHAFVRRWASPGLDVCVWLRERGCTCLDGDVLTAAAGAGQQAVCEWLLTTGCLNHWGAAAAAAARGGHVGLMDWLLALTINVQSIHCLLGGAAEGCSLPTLQRLLLTYLNTLPVAMPAVYGLGILGASARSPTADWQAKVECLQSRSFPWTAAACTMAAAKADALPRLQWLRQRGYPFNSAVATNAAGAGNVEALQYVLGQGVEVNAHMLQSAAEGGHVAVMEVLHARGASVGEDAVRTAAAAGHLPAVAWLVERMGAGAALTTSVFAAAARAGSMELLGWLRERGCPWDATAFAAAVEGGSEEQLEWLVEKGCPMGDDGEPYARAARHGDLAMLRCLRRLGCPWGHDGSTLTHAVTGFTCDSRAVLQRMFSWLLDQGCPVDWDAVEADALRKKDEGLVGWLHAQREQRARAGNGGLQP
ncbi:Ankyrin repeat domain-containing protein [Tetrabaena socialis]|uniref:Ankyrin repeat domain-containing protein n=1 Tax=Tetrabaena socialis TaxID=47790 RepID=A0A2J7ZTC0_9CHLO|nr:Ankyrin repeat domain-containing protein [Tetrabaena socialis]|eukprot:PNH03502.1 Ankyrin repeat domain-containing protein [Tetrabaena socialis]